MVYTKASNITMFFKENYNKVVLGMFWYQYVKIFVLIFLFNEANSSTHWVVTEDGKIKQKLDSPFAMKQPDDLVAFMRQERTYTHLQKRKEELLQEQVDIDRNEDKDVQLESRHYRQDPDCRAAGKRLPDFDLFITSILPLEHKEIQISDHINLSEVSPSDAEQPNCTNFYDLPFSVHAYDHLEGVQNRRFFPHHPVSGLKSSMPFLKDENAAAAAIFKALKKNSTSWVLYNLAAFYWRMKGNLNEAVECLRRALHFSPENYKDVALVSLANILHRVHFTLNATVLMHHALKISDEYSINHFTLANMYAALGQYNVSVHYYEETLKRQKDFETALKELAAVKCQLKLQEKLENQHLSLQRTLKELQEYKVRHDKFVQQQEDFASLHIPARVLAEQHMVYEQRRLKEGTFNSDCHLRKVRSGGQIIVCNLPTNEPAMPPLLDENLELFFEEPEPLKMTAITQKNNENNITMQQPRPRKKRKKPNPSSGTENGLQPDESELSSAGSSNSTFTGFYDWSDPSWPPPGSCEKYAGKNPIWDDFPSAYIDPETRGFKVRELITTELGLIGEEMHPQPWNPPNCEDLEELRETPYDHFVHLENTTPRLKRDTFLQNYLYTHVNKGYVWPKDLGQRILHALQSAVSENDNEKKWILYNLAGLYWRVEGDNEKAIECLRRSVHYAPASYADIPLVSMSNIMYRMGKINNSVDLLLFALKVNNTEPATYLSMGNSLQARNNITGAMVFYNYATILNPKYQEAFQSLLIVKCRNRTRQNNTKSPEEIIAQWNADVAKIEKEKNDKINEEKTQQKDGQNGLETHLKTAEKNSKQLEEAEDDINQWLMKTDTFLNELQTASEEELQEKLDAANLLIDKLAEVRTSLGELANKVSLDSKKTRESFPDKIISKEDFFVSNTSYLSSFEIVIDDVATTDDLPPTCGMPLTHVIDDVTWVNSVTTGPQEQEFEKVLQSLLRTSDVANALRSALISDPNSWRYLFVASFFWRITGDTQQVFACLLRSLSSAPADAHDLPLYAIADYLAVLMLYDDAAISAMKLKPSKHARYLLYKIYTAKGDHKAAEKYFN